MTKNTVDTRVLNKVEKEMGIKIGKFSEMMPDKVENVIPTGCLRLDMALGCGGWPRGRVVEIYGPEAGGKTTLALLAIAAVQKLGENALFVDAENSFDRKFAEGTGVDVDNLYYTQPDFAEQAFYAIEQHLDSKSFSVIVVDSVTALVPKREMEGTLDDEHYAPLARVMSRALNRLSKKISESNTLVIFINQVRDNVGVMYGPKETTPGGRALKFYSSVRLRVSNKNAERIVDDQKRMIGIRPTVKIVKNKLGPPLGEVQYELIFGKGINNESNTFEIARDLDIITRDGNTYYFKDEKLEVGEKKTTDLIMSDPALLKEITEMIDKELRG